MSKKRTAMMNSDSKFPQLPAAPLAPVEELSKALSNNANFFSHSNHSPLTGGNND
jgi:hypothetical protein